MKKIKLFLLIAILAGFYSCKTDFDINAPEKDITVVFGLLDQNDAYHYVRISKAFIGDQDALVMAQDPAYSSYGDDLDVYVEEYRNGNKTHTFYCKDTTITDKEAGIFYYPSQEIYVFKGALNVDCRYRIIIKNKETGNTVDAETGLVRDFSIEQPVYLPPPLVSQMTFYGDNDRYAQGDAKWISARNGRLYEPLFRFYYKETDKTTLATSIRSIDWALNSVKSSKLDGGETMLISYNAESFYSYLGQKIPVDNNIERSLVDGGRVDFIISVGGDELSTYIDLNRPSNSLIQERPAFTNVTNGGIGIFSCRHTKTLTYKLTGSSATELISGKYTSHLGFTP